MCLHDKEVFNVLTSTSINDEAFKEYVKIHGSHALNILDELEQAGDVFEKQSQPKREGISDIQP